MTIQSVAPSTGSPVGATDLALSALPNAPAATDDLPAARTQLADGLRRLVARVAPEPAAAARNATSH
jgi:hypothetical protein